MECHIHTCLISSVACNIKLRITNIYMYNWKFSLSLLVIFSVESVFCKQTGPKTEPCGTPCKSMTVRE